MLLFILEQIPNATYKMVLHVLKKSDLKCSISFLSFIAKYSIIYNFLRSIYFDSLNASTQACIVTAPRTRKCNISHKIFSVVTVWNLDDIHVQVHGFRSYTLHRTWPVMIYFLFLINYSVVLGFCYIVQDCICTSVAISCSCCTWSVFLTCSVNAPWSPCMGYF